MSFHGRSIDFYGRSINFYDRAVNSKSCPVNIYAREVVRHTQTALSRKEELRGMDRMLRNFFN